MTMPVLETVSAERDRLLRTQSGAPSPSQIGNAQICDADLC
jgi:hypothetical protein